MSKTKSFLTQWKGLVAVLGLLLLITLVLVGCGGEPAAPPAEPTEIAAEPVAPTSAPTEPPTPTEAPAESPTPTDSPTEPPTPTEAPTEPPPTATPTEEPTPEPVDDTACIACHTDEETLKAVAKEEGTPEVESEGEG